MDADAKINLSRVPERVAKETVRDAAKASGSAPEADLEAHDPMIDLFSLDEWHEDFGPALWWFFPVVEEPYVGTPLDTDWPGYHTHWTRFVVPDAPGAPTTGR